jgi:hypothetical protein
MSKINTFIKLPSRRKTLLIKSLGLIALIRLMLYLLSFSRVRKFSARISGQKGNGDLVDLVWAVNVAGEYVPRSTCLSKAMAVQIFLSRHNYPSQLKIGVIKEDDFEAHAWVEVEDEVVVGESKRDYVPILDLDVEQ